MSLSKQSKGTKWKGHYDESRRFKPEWQRKYPWVKKAVDGSDMAYCSFCRVNIQPRESNLKQHEETSKHVKITSSVSSSRRLFAQKPKDDKEIGDSIFCCNSMPQCNHVHRPSWRNNSTWWNWFKIREIEAASHQMCKSDNEHCFTSFTQRFVQRYRLLKVLCHD